jgi:hypothetical protein
MAHYAILDQNNIVTSVFVGRDDAGTDWEAYYGAKKTSYNTRLGVHYDPSTGLPSADQTKAFRGNYAGVGFKYDPTLDAFIPPQPFPSWVLDPKSFGWSAPVPYPSDGQSYEWDEDTKTWIVT